MSVLTNVPVNAMEETLKNEINTLFAKYFINEELCEKLITEILKGTYQFIINDLCIRRIILERAESIIEIDQCLINRGEILEKNEMWIFFSFIRDCMKNVIRLNKSGTSGKSGKSGKTGKGYTKKRKRYRKKIGKSRR